MSKFIIDFLIGVIIANGVITFWLTNNFLRLRKEVKKIKKKVKKHGI